MKGRGSGGGARLATIAMGLGLTAGCAGGLDAEPTGGAIPDVGDTATVGHQTAQIVGQAPRASQGTPAVIMLHPHDDLEIPVPADAAVMDQFGRDFIPRLLVVQQGQAVLFKNSEDELHTVHVQDEAGESLFNVGMPIRGGEHRYTFDVAGDYDVSCNAHQEMHATILVVPNAYSTVAERDGSFELSGVAPGVYDLVLRQGGRRFEHTVEVTTGVNRLQVDFPSAG